MISAIATLTKPHCAPAVLARKVGEKTTVGFAYFVRHAGEWKIDQM